MISEKESLLTILAKNLSRTVFYICLTIVACFWVDSCQLDSATILNCEKACKYGLSVHMESVTARECRCYSGENISSDIWVLPKK